MPAAPPRNSSTSIPQAPHSPGMPHAPLIIQEQATGSTNLVEIEFSVNSAELDKLCPCGCSAVKPYRSSSQVPDAAAAAVSGWLEAHAAGLCGVGDRDNAVYGQLYALDQASYSRHDPLRISAGARARSGYAYGCASQLWKSRSMSPIA